MRQLKIYSANWCQPCQQLKKTIAAGNLNLPITTIDIEAWKEEAAADGVRSIPTLILIEEGVELKRTTGYKNLEQLTTFINS